MASYSSTRFDVRIRQVLASGQGMLHHVSLGVADLKRSAEFYDAVLSELGYVGVWAQDNAIGYGYPGGEDQLAIKLVAGLAQAPGPGFHLALTAPDRKSVEAFHRSALLQGGRDNGLPGLRSNYGLHYFAAFVIDPEGHRVEAVCDKEV
jgi:catechol 2,3-dioxygenase-like lactoylglutathione lyase family enzyme